ncbi:hypothetical protein ABZ690_19380 [Streptomyces sp. NPDC006967]|uniref:hypothetical protein n=1 Tax=unclassified Streptomyces TaxID=2593676 RepID=UPI0033F599D0
MNLTKPTRVPRAALAVKAVRDARTRIRTRAEFVRIIAAQLHIIAPGTARVSIAPLIVEGRRRQWVILDDAAGHPIEADADAHCAALGLLTRAFPVADWSVPRTYDATTGDLAADVPPAPAALGIDTAPEARP